jgi:hypothetical protein
MGTDRPIATAGKVGWHPDNWIIESGDCDPLPEESQPAFTFRAAGPNCYWHTERFVSSRADGKIIIRLEAKSSAAPCRHRVWIFEDGSYRSVGEIVVGSDWLTFEIPIVTSPGSMLELQIDQPDDRQWLSIRDIQVVGGASPPLVMQVPVVIPMAAWTGEGVPCAEAGPDCRQWTVSGKKGYVQTPILPKPGEAGWLICFEARVDRTAVKFTSVYLFEGDKFRSVARYAFGSEWREFRLLLRADRTVPIKIQIDYPESVEFLLIRNFHAIPVDPEKATPN